MIGNETFSFIMSRHYRAIVAPVSWQIVAFAAAARLTLFLPNMGSGDEMCCWHPMPSRWDLGNLKFRVYWYTNNVGGATNTWDISAKSYGDNEDMEQAPAFTGVFRAGLPGVKILHVSPELSIAPSAGADADPAGMFFNIKRASGSGGTPWLLGFRVEWTLA